MAQRALSVSAAAGMEVGPSPERLKVSQRVIADNDDGAPMPTVAAVGPAPRNVRLAAKALTAVPAGARLHVDPRAVMKHPPIVTALLGSGRPSATGGAIGYG
jgi:hypothetical protein